MFSDYCAVHAEMNSRKRHGQERRYPDYQHRAIAATRMIQAGCLFQCGAGRRGIKEFGFYVGHPGPSPEFYQWALDMQLKSSAWIAAAPTHPNEHGPSPDARKSFQAGRREIEARVRQLVDEMFPPGRVFTPYPHHAAQGAPGLVCEADVGDIDKLRTQRRGIHDHAHPRCRSRQSVGARRGPIQAAGCMSEDEFNARPMNRAR